MSLIEGNREAMLFASKEFEALMRQVVIDGTWAKGVPMVYLDEKGRIIRHFKDGRIEVIQEKTCPTPTKVKFSTEKDALMSLKKITEVSDKKKKPIRAYLCECGLWHLSSTIDRVDVKLAPYKKQIELLKDAVKKMEGVSAENLNTISQLKQTIEELKKRNGKEEQIAVRSNSRVKSLMEEVSGLKKANKKLKEETWNLHHKLRNKESEK